MLIKGKLLFVKKSFTEEKAGIKKLKRANKNINKPLIGKDNKKKDFFCYNRMVCGKD